MLNRGVSAPSGQLSPALWLSGCTNATADPHSGVSNGGWTQPSLRLFLDFLESKGIRSLDIWSQPDREERGANPTTDVPCDWALDELRRWIKQTTSSLKSDSSLPDGRQSNLKTDDASVGSNWQLDVDLESAVLPTSNFSTRECYATWVPGAGACAAATGRVLTTKRAPPPTRFSSTALWLENQPARRARAGSPGPRGRQGRAQMYM